MAKKKKQHPFKQRDAEVERDKADVESQGQAGLPEESAGNGANGANDANDATPVEPSATATQPKPTVGAPHEVPQTSHTIVHGGEETIVGPLSSIGPSELLDRLKEAGTGKSKIEAGRAFILAHKGMTTSEDMVEALGSNPRDHSGGGKLRAVGYWPAGTVRKATAILQASLAGGA